MLIIHYIHFKSQHTVVRAMHGLSVTVLGFALAVIVFEILSIGWQNDAFFPKNRVSFLLFAYQKIVFEQKFHDYPTFEAVVPYNISGSRGSVTDDTP